MRILIVIFFLNVSFFSFPHAEVINKCDSKYLSEPLFFYKVSDPDAKIKKYIYTAEIGNLKLCKHSLRRGQSKTGSNDITLVTKKEFCKSKNQYYEKDNFWLTLGDYAKKFCDIDSFNKDIVIELYRNKAQSMNLDGMKNLGDYKNYTIRDDLIDQILNNEEGRN